MRTPLVAGNWKLNGSRKANAALLQAVLAGLARADKSQVMVCPSYVYLPAAVAAAQGSSLLVGAQDVAVESSGAFTGEVSADMLADVGCSHVIVGHSERRSLYGDTDERVAAKFQAARAAGLIPILCVGETLDERESGQSLAVVTRQLEAVISAHGVAAFADAIVAYEPVWAIGTGRTASPEQAQEIHAGIRSLVGSADARIAADLRLLYGGSVKGANAADLFGMADIDGGLIGGASLDAEDFLTICAAAGRAS